MKLIASDVDGTLIPEGGATLNPELFDVIRKLKEKGIMFVAASGRPYISMQHAFQEVLTDIYFISNNGGMVNYQGKVIDIKEIPADVQREILSYFRSQKNTFYILTTPEMDYTDCRDEELLKWLREGYRLNVTVVDDAAKLQGPFIKMAIYYKDVDAMEMVGPARERFGDQVSIVGSGAHWIDFVNKEAQKGIALESIQKMLGVTKEETMAFGDNDNDISLLMAAEDSYAVSKARENVKEAAKYVLADTTTETVLNVLKTLL